MRRVLVPLDGSRLATSILPDARRLAGPDGELVLIQVVDSAVYDYSSSIYPEYGMRSEPPVIEAAQHYLEAEAERLRMDGVRVRVEAMVGVTAAGAIDEAASIFQVDMIACATHARSPVGRLFRRGVVWSALAHSPVPVLLRHPDKHERGDLEMEPAVRRILVPLDGSELAEKALPLAWELADEWKASLWLARVVPDVPMSAAARKRPLAPTSHEIAGEIQVAEAYLGQVAGECTGETHASVFVGPIVDALLKAVAEWSITDVVMATHGRTGLARAVLGSVADDLIQHVHCPMILIQALATVPASRIERGQEEARAAQPV